MNGGKVESLTITNLLGKINIPPNGIRFKYKEYSKSYFRNVIDGNMVTEG